MATTYKTFLNNDITSTKTLLHESIPLTGALVSGTYGTYPSGSNIKNYAHGMFQSVYDYPYLSSSANHIFDITCGYAPGSPLSSSTSEQNAKKINIYNQMAQVLVGYDATGSILKFDEDGNITDGGTKIDSGYFLNFSRLLSKDEIKKGSFSMKIGTGSWASPMSTANVAGDGRVTITDTNAQNDYRVNSPAGEYGILSMSVGYDPDGIVAPSVGLIFYQAGIIFLSSSVFFRTSQGGVLQSNADTDMTMAGNNNITASFTGSLIQDAANNLRHRIDNISFNNTTELNSTIHFCRINHNDFNYSSNPTYLSQSKIVVKNNTQDAPISYITTVGLYSADNELLAVAKLSEALKKDPTNEMTVRVRLDY